MPFSIIQTLNNLNDARLLLIADIEDTFGRSQERSRIRDSFRFQRDSLSSENRRLFNELLPTLERIRAQRAQNLIVPPLQQVTAVPIVRPSDDQLLHPLSDPLSDPDNNLIIVNLDFRDLVSDMFIVHAFASTDVQQENPQNVPYPGILTDDDLRFVGNEPDISGLTDSIVLE